MNLFFEDKHSTAIMRGNNKYHLQHYDLSPAWDNDDT